MVNITGILLGTLVLVLIYGLFNFVITPRRSIYIIPKKWLEDMFEGLTDALVDDFVTAVIDMHTDGKSREEILDLLHVITPDVFGFSEVEGGYVDEEDYKYVKRENAKGGKYNE